MPQISGDVSNHASIQITYNNTRDKICVMNFGLASQNSSYRKIPLGHNSYNGISIPKSPITQTSLPSLFLSTPRSLVNKIEDLEIVIKNNHVDVVCITETC